MVLVSSERTADGTRDITHRWGLSPNRHVLAYPTLRSWEDGPAILESRLRGRRERGTAR
jgi:hypothetical protein